MKTIIELVRAAFDAKRIFGPESVEFKAAQLAAMEEVNRRCQLGDNQLINTHDKDDAGLEIGIRIQKRGEGALFCSYVLETIPAPQEKEVANKVKEKRHPWPHKS
jgi:hypothetical protein